MVICTAGLLGIGEQASAVRATAFARVSISSSVAAAVSDCTLVIEAVAEDPDVKTEVLTLCFHRA
jgi:3-hydroxyacyl-CoA dehydrogenase